MRVHLCSLTRCCTPKTRGSAKFREKKLKNWTYSSSRSSKVIDLSSSQKRICDFLLVRYSSLTSVVSCTVSRHCYLLVENCVFFIPLLHSAPPLPMFPLKFRGEVNHEETKSHGLLCGESCIILTSTVFDWSTHVTDRQSDRRTDGRTDGR